MFAFLKKLFSSSNDDALRAAISKGAYLVDVRTPAEFAAGHVKGSVNIPLDTVPQQINQFKGKDHIVVFCRTGNRSGQAKTFLEQNGIVNVINGGAWESVGEVVASA